VTPNGATIPVALPNAHLNATVSPLFQLSAFRFGPGYGELALNYRFLITEGSDLLPAFDGPGQALFHSRLNLQIFSLDFIRNDCPLGTDTLLSWEVGGRLQVVFFDTRAQTASSFQQARNSFYGAGPHAGVGLTRLLPSRLELFGRFDAAALVGYNTTQSFVAATNDPVLGVLAGTSNQQQTEISPTISVQLGLTWSPTWLPACRVRGGYQFEEWYNLGRVKDSRGDLSAQGLFASCELQF
jgi:hypothetical protein